MCFFVYVYKYFIYYYRTKSNVSPVRVQEKKNLQYDSSSQEYFTCPEGSEDESTKAEEKKIWDLLRQSLQVFSKIFFFLF